MHSLLMAGDFAAVFPSPSCSTLLCLSLTSKGGRQWVKVMGNTMYQQRLGQVIPHTQSLSEELNQARSPSLGP